jgi:hypothetical protein
MNNYRLQAARCGLFAVLYLISPALACPTAAAQEAMAAQTTPVPRSGPEPEAGATGFEGGLRLGYGIPLGKSSGRGEDMNEGISGQAPLWIDLGYRIIPPLFLGLYFQYGLGFLGDDLERSCDEGNADCSVVDIRFGAQVQYHPYPGRAGDLWLGAGIGYEWLTISTDEAGLNIGVTMRGFEYFSLQLGVDFTVTHHFYLGPFLAISGGEFSSTSVSCSGDPSCSAFEAEMSQDIDDKSLHSWIFIGVRGGYEP